MPGEPSTNSYSFCNMIFMSQCSSFFCTLIFSQKVLAQGTQVSCRWPWSITLPGPEALPLNQCVWPEPLACEPPLPCSLMASRPLPLMFIQPYLGPAGWTESGGDYPYPPKCPLLSSEVPTIPQWNSCSTDLQICPGSSVTPGSSRP